MRPRLWQLLSLGMFCLILISCQDGSGSVLPRPTLTATVAAPMPTVGRAALPTTNTTPTVPVPIATPAPPTATLTPSPSPTATADPISYFGDPWAFAQQLAIAPRGGSCGLVDWLDFPLNPPDGDGLRGGSDFGLFRNRYDKYHAGEDWGFGRGGGSFGKPVYAIGAGLVTYAQPLGWGRDQGVIIVRHTFSDGGEILSFYGHLDPPGFLVEAGDCVARGQEIAAIGRPRSSPHLHFEIRTHLPWTPGPGYWETDPIPEGWLPPSQIVMNSRAQIMPGVRWAQIMPYDGNQFVAALPDGDLLLLEQGGLASRDSQTGRLNFRLAGDHPLLAAALDQAGTLIFLADDEEQVMAVALENIASIVRQDGSTVALAPLWQTEIRFGGRPRLLAGPAGGLLLSAGRTLHYLHADGEAAWQTTLGGQLLDWLPNDAGLLLATGGVTAELWQVGSAGSQLLSEELSGWLARTGRGSWLYGDGGLYQLQPDDGQLRATYTLPNGYLGSGAILPLPDDRLLLIHRDARDKRLLMFNPDGSLLWQRSLTNQLQGELTLHWHQGQIYLIAQGSDVSTDNAQLFWLDEASRELLLLFSSGSRTSRPQESWVQTVGDDLLLHIGGGSLVLLDPVAALTTIQATDTRLMATRTAP